ncbi:MAG: hypothetical protein H0V89_01305, partial [Deltaproteobacteria bacterium]|nr:hypothetical protein [Deltaproteobacteria bacterium]
MSRWLAGVALIAACKKEVVDTGPTGSCDDLGTVVLSSVSATEYPEGLAEQLVLWREIPGVYTADYCGKGEVTIKLDSMAIPEDLEYVTSPIDERIPCGCTTDPQFADDDNALGAYVWSFQGSFFLFDEFNEFDPLIVEEAINAQVIPVTWALLPSGAPFSMRGCANDAPIVDSTATYEEASVVIRVDPAGGLSGTVQLNGPDATVEC